MDFIIRLSEIICFLLILLPHFPSLTVLLLLVLFLSHPPSFCFNVTCFMFSLSLSFFLSFSSPFPNFSLSLFSNLTFSSFFVNFTLCVLVPLLSSSLHICLLSLQPLLKGKTKYNLKEKKKGKKLVVEAAVWYSESCSNPFGPCILTWSLQ